MNQFTIKDIENLCGIKAHTLRIWEQRYQFFIAKRKESQHRVYDNDDLKELLRISYLYHNGHKISKIAALSTEEIYGLVQQSYENGCNHEIYVHQLLEAGMDFDKEKFERTVNCLVLRIGLEKSLKDVLFPFLQRIGVLWMTNHLIPAQEHFVSHIIRKKIIMATDGLELREPGENNILVFAPKGEFHEIPLLAANYFFRKYLNHSIYFGTNVLRETLQQYMNEYPVRFLYAHVITHMDNCGMNKYAENLCNQFPDKQILLSGPATKCIEYKPANLTVIQSIGELIAFAKANSREESISALHNSVHPPL